jgi:hypothetical protein
MSTQAIAENKCREIYREAQAFFITLGRAGPIDCDFGVTLNSRHQGVDFRPGAETYLNFLN